MFWAITLVGTLANCAPEYIYSIYYIYYVSMYCFLKLNKSKTMIFLMDFWQTILRFKKREFRYLIGENSQLFFAAKKLDNYNTCTYHSE